jgi:two-component system CheB/CheR fusion protein
MTAVVGLGGSAGSITALQKFFTRMPADSGLAFVVVLHLSPKYESNLAQLVQNLTPMPVTQVSAAVKVEANCVYVIPPGKQLLMADGQLILHDLPREYGTRAAVDIFFRSLAETHGSRSTGIVLSGLDGDGSIGIKRIKENGGLTVAQDPNEAEHEGMPRSAIETGMVDWVLAVDEMPRQLLEYQKIQERVRLPEEKQPADGPNQEADGEKALRETISFLRIRKAHDFSYFKRNTVLRRIRRRMQLNNIEDLPAYLAFLRLNPNEAEALTHDLLANVTNFFRDLEAFQALQAEVPKLLADKKPADEIRVWVPGCATGEEAYSMAILLSEATAKLAAFPSIKVFATDVDQGSIEVGRAGLYSAAITADVSPERLRLFFSKESAGYRVKRGIRETVFFAQHDLLKDPPFSNLDLVSCRNLLIYLDAAAQRRIFQIFHFALRENGILFLGAAESVGAAGERLNALNKKYRVYARERVM